MMIRNQQGVTLMELMIAVVVVGILSAVAVPSYTEYIKRGARAEARAALLENALLMEQKFTVNNSYILPTATPPLGFVLQSPKQGGAKYVISIVDGATATTYTLQAVPASPDKCGTYTLDNTGLRALVSASASVEECWGA